MSSTNKTTYYELPQFVDNDIFNPLVDDNDAYSKIDTALHNIADAEAGDASEIVSIKSRLDSAEGDIDALEAQNGNSVLTTTAQTLSGAVNELDADVASLDGRVDIVEDDINNVSTGLKAKVGALETLTDSLYHGGVEDGSIEYNKLSVTAKKFLEDNAEIIFMKIDGDTAGNCTVVITKHGKVVMLDSGFAPMYDNIKAQLAENNISRVDYFLLSHYHQDHFGNVQSMVTDGYIDSDTVCYLPRRNANATWNSYDDSIRDILADMEKIVYDSTSPLIVDGFIFSFFNCDLADYARYDSEAVDDMNIYCVMTYVESNKFTLLMMADATAEAVLYNTAKFKKVDVLQIPHHGYRAGESDLELYNITRPDYGVVFMPSSFYTSVDDYLRTSTRLQYLTALGIPFYMTGLSNVYIGLDDNDYSVISPSFKVPARNTSTVKIYVDKSYTGIGCGTASRPFNSMSQALAFVSQYDKFCSTFNIIIVGAYDGSDEILDIYSNSNITIDGTITDDVYNVKFNRILVSKGYVRLNRIELVYAGSSSALYVAHHAFVFAQYLKIIGDTTAITTHHEGLAVECINSAKVRMDYVTISNHNIAFYTNANGSIYASNTAGTGNTHIASGTNGGSIIITDANMVFTGTMIDRRYKGNVPCDVFRMGNAETLSYGYCANSPFEAFSSVHDNEQTDTLNLESSCYRSKIFKIMCINGAEYMCSKTGEGNLSTPIQIRSAIDSSDNTFAVTLSSQNVLSITHSSMIKVIGM